METDFYGPFFKFCRRIVRSVFPRYKTELPEKMTGPVVYIAHHQNLFGPFVILLWFRKSLHAWMLHVFLDQEACFRQYVDFTFTKRFGWNRTFAKMAVYPISYFIATLLSSAGGIPVYRGSRKIIKTFQLSAEALARGESIVIFPDIDYSDTSAGIKEMYDGFLNLEKYYYKATGRHLSFVPLYVSKKRRLLLANEQFHFRDGVDFAAERKNVYEKIQNHLNELAVLCGDLAKEIQVKEKPDNPTINGA